MYSLDIINFQHPIDESHEFKKYNNGNMSSIVFRKKNTKNTIIIDFYENGNVLCKIYQVGSLRDNWMSPDSPAYIGYCENINGKVGCEIYYKDGKRHRLGNLPAYITYYDDGSIYMTEYWVNGMRYRDDGFNLIWYYPDGSIQLECNDPSNKLSSENVNPSYNEYYKNGQIKIRKYKGSLKLERPSYTEYYENGNIKLEIYYYNGLKHREPIIHGNVKKHLPAQILYYISGQIQHESYWLEGKLYKPIKSYNMDGTLAINVNTGGKVKDNTILGLNDYQNF